MSEWRPEAQRPGHFGAVLIFASVLSLCACKKSEPGPRAVALPVGTVLHDVSFRSDALGRYETYRVIAPASFRVGEPVRVLYLLHGNGSGFREWSESSSIAQLAADGYVLVMPEGHSSYFMNVASKPGEKYEDFITHDLISDVERGLPRPVGRPDRAIVGVSMGGFASIVLGLKHPGLYGFIGALSPPVDMPRRRFTWRRISQSLQIRSIFGAEGSSTRTANDPFVLARIVDAGSMPFIFLSVGQQESLLEPVQRFDDLLKMRRIPHEFRVTAGGHDWTQWSKQSPAMIEALQGNLECDRAALDTHLLR